MRISLNWLKKYVKIPETVSSEELIRLIGARLVEVEGVIDETTKYNNIYIVRVEKAEKIPETHLTLCEINDGSSELVQVVCGAPNVREGMLAVWIKPGAIVPASVHEDSPFVIGKRKMLGKYESNGMLAGADELDFGDDHSGIVEIDPEMAKPGDLLSDIFELNDLVLEIENKSLTHRPDCFGIIGFAREVAGILGVNFESGVLSDIKKKFGSDFSRDGSLESGVLSGIKKKFGSDFSRDGSLAPVVTGLAPSSSVVTSGSPRKVLSELLQVPIDEGFRSELTLCIDNSVCSRYSAVLLEKHGELKKKYLTWQDTILSKSGMRPINPIVDATNHLMLLTGQPLHAFDFDKFVKVGGTNEAKIGVRLARTGEKLVLIDDREIELNDNDIIITSNDVPVALGGAMGGKSTEIDAETRKIIIESASFSLYNLRKTQMAHGIFSEAVTRFTKGQPAFQTLTVAGECAKLLADGYKVVGISDEYPNPEKENVVKITTCEINALLGTDYSDDVIINTLSNVGFMVTASKSDNGQGEIATLLDVHVPKWRTDIRIKEDVIEEVGRLLGYDNILPTLPLHRTAEKNPMFDLKKELRELLSGHGANEVLTYSFVSEDLLLNAKQDPKNSYRIVNSISPELQYIRQSLIPSLLDKVYMNSKIPYNEFALFEMNEVYQKEFGLDEDNVPVNKMRLGFVIYERKNDKTAYYKAKKYLSMILKHTGINVSLKSMIKKHNSMIFYEEKRAAEVYAGEDLIGYIGEFKNSVKNSFKLGDYLAGFELDLEKILELKNEKKKIDACFKYESRDVTIKTDKSYEAIINKVNEVLARFEESAKIVPVAIYQPEGEEKRITIRLVFNEKANENVMEELENL